MGHSSLGGQAQRRMSHFLLELLRISSTAESMGNGAVSAASLSTLTAAFSTKSPLRPVAAILESCGPRLMPRLERKADHQGSAHLPQTDVDNHVETSASTNSSGGVTTPTRSRGQDAPMFSPAPAVVSSSRLLRGDTGNSSDVIGEILRNCFPAGAGRLTDAERESLQAHSFTTVTRICKLYPQCAVQRW